MCTNLRKKFQPKSGLPQKLWLLSLVALVLFIESAQAQFSVLYSFSNSSGARPCGAPIQGLDGNFYGTTIQGGAGGSGTIFMLTPQGTMTILHNFSDGTVTNDGANPVAGLVRDSEGNFYGTTSRGGGSGCMGVAFKISKTGVYSVLHRFNYTTEPYNLASPLVIGSDGNFYSSAPNGPGIFSGSIFRMTPQGELSTIYKFGSTSQDGAMPGDLMQAPDGNLYGMTFSGGSYSLGTIFKVTTAGVQTTLVNFSSVAFDPNGSAPSPSALRMGNDGYLYGSTPGHAAGYYNDGVVFKMTTRGALTKLATITCGSPLLLGADGNFYTCTTKGGGGLNVGGIVQMTPQGSVVYLHNWESTTFDANGAGFLTQTSDGTFYGYTSDGGQNFYGTAFKLALIPPTITSTPPSDGSVNSGYYYTITGTGLPSPKFSVTAGALPPGLTLYSYGGLVGTPTKAGVYTGTITANNGASPAAAQVFSITVSSPFSSWSSQYFTAQQLADPTISDPAAMPENDGVPNLLKYLFDINPAQAMSSLDRIALSSLGTTTVAGNSYLTLTYRKNQFATGITVNVQTSSDLQSWQTVMPDITRNLSPDPLTGDPVIEVGVDTTGGDKKFIRLNVTMP